MEIKLPNNRKVIINVIKDIRRMPKNSDTMGLSHCCHVDHQQIELIPCVEVENGRHMREGQASVLLHELVHAAISSFPGMRDRISDETEEMFCEAIVDYLSPLLVSSLEELIVAIARDEHLDYSDIKRLWAADKIMRDLVVKPPPKFNLKKRRPIL